MAITWTTTKTKGVRYREHHERKHGVKFDRYFSIRHYVDGKRVEEALGWSSEGWSEKKAAAILAELRANTTTSSGPRTLAEKNQAENHKRAEIEKEKFLATQKQTRDSQTIVNVVFNNYAETNTHKKSLRDEKSYFKNWIRPVIGSKKLNDVILFDLEKIKSNMTKAGKSARTIGYIKAIIRQIFHYAIENKLYAGEVPTTHFLKKQTLDNKRKRYLNNDEATLLLTEIKKHSLTTYRISLLSLNSGMRFSEIAALQWQHINISNKEILISDPKNGESRSAYMTEQVLHMFSELQPGKPGDLVFPSSNGKQMGRISKVFAETVDKLGMNEGSGDDRRMKLVFHSLRHSCASNLVNAGVAIPVIGKVLGHKTLAMTERYSHINDNSMRQAMAVLDNQQEKIIKFQKTSVR